MAEIVVAVLFTCMVAVAVYGWRAIPSDARFRTRMGPTGIDASLGKRAGLLTWPALGLFVLVGTLSTSVGWLGAAVIAWLLVFELVSVNSTARH